MKKIYIIAFIFLALIPGISWAQSEEKTLQEAQFYFLVDADTNEVLLSKNADLRIAPSSMTKIMTAYVVFSQIQKGNINFNKQCTVSREAWRKSGSSMFLNYGDIVTVEDLVKGLLVVSGNDAAIALAQNISGSVNNFVALMNQEAQELGLKNSHFRNPHGLNEPGHYMSLRDLATLTTRLYENFPQYSHYLGIEEFTYGKITQRNRNPLIKHDYEGTVGGKTGHTNEGGYGIVGVVKRDHRRLIAVVNKARTPKKREEIVKALLNYGFEDYKKLVFFNKDQTIASVNTWLGSSSKVDVVTNQEIAVNIPQSKSAAAISAKIKYKGPVYAPISRGAKVATLVIDVHGYKTFEFSLFAKENVDKAGILKRISSVFRYKVRNFLHRVFY